LTTTTARPDPSTTNATSTTVIVEGLRGFATVEIILNGEALLVAVADTSERRAQGLMGVTDLGDLDGMVFLHSEPVTSKFWMKDTVIPLDIAFFATDGTLLGVLTMEPCTADPCPTYGVDEPYQWAIEVPSGRFNELSPDATLFVLRDPFLPLIQEA
jgi:hypothetical protein